MGTAVTLAVIVVSLALRLPDACLWKAAGGPKHSPAMRQQVRTSLPLRASLGVGVAGLAVK